MNRHEQTTLRAEERFLANQIARLPAAGSTLTRRSLQRRLDGIQARLAEEAVDATEPAKSRLTFRGRPVRGTHGIAADFGVAATKAFADAVSAVAASFAGPLAAVGRIPNREQNQLLITGTALGSFGFEFEEARRPELPLLHAESALSQALTTTVRLFENTTRSDDELADSIAEIDPRALEKVKTFLAILADNEAACAVETETASFRFLDSNQVSQSALRLSNDNVREDQVIVNGYFAGVLPNHRNFEFQADNEPDVFYGKIAPSVADPYGLAANVRQRYTAIFARTRVGDGAPRYVLLQANRIQQLEVE